MSTRDNAPPPEGWQPIPRPDPFETGLSSLEALPENLVLGEN